MSTVTTINQHGEREHCLDISGRMGTRDVSVIILNPFRHSTPPPSGVFRIWPQTRSLPPSLLSSPLLSSPSIPRYASRSLPLSPWFLSIVKWIPSNNASKSYCHPMNTDISLCRAYPTAALNKSFEHESSSFEHAPKSEELNPNKGSLLTGMGGGVNSERE